MKDMHAEEEASLAGGTELAKTLLPAEAVELARFFVVDAAQRVGEAIARNSRNSRLTKVEETAPSPEADGGWRVGVDAARWAEAFADFWEKQLPYLELEVEGARDAEAEAAAMSETAEFAEAPAEREDAESTPVAVAVSVAADELARTDIEVLRGKTGTYLFAEKVMTRTYARWAFLAAEGDDLATFLSCVREESRVYPRPMQARSLENAPFRMTAEQVSQLYQRAIEMPENADIATTQASNGDVYYFSTDYLSPKRAEKMAERFSVWRAMNP